MLFSDGALGSDNAEYVLNQYGPLQSRSLSSIRQFLILALP